MGVTALLTDTTLRTLKPAAKPYKRSDAKGLYILINPDGSKYWRFKYRVEGREKLLSMGTYPDTSLKLARSSRDAAREQLAAGGDPSEARRAEKSAQADTFELVSRDWLAKQKKLDPGTIAQLMRRLEKYVWPVIGKKPIGKITAADMLRVLRKIEAGGTHETAHRVRSVCGRVFRYAVATEQAERDVTADLRGALTPVKATNFAAITEPKRIGQLLCAIAGYEGQPTVAAALSLAPLAFVRPSELRGAEWVEFDFDAAEWRIPAARMKMRRDHIVPLSTQAIAILRDLQKHTGRGRLLFPSLRTATRPISENTLNAALRRMGYAKDEMTTHGFRSLASTRLNELGYNGDLIELQLAHLDRNKVRSAYNRAARLDERRKMMQSWADHLDALSAETLARQEDPS